MDEGGRLTESVADFDRRKEEHIEAAFHSWSEVTEGCGLDRVHLEHEALPEMNLDEADLTTEFLSEKVMPLYVSSMTAGHAGAYEINLRLAQASAQHHWILGVGSQRRELLDPASSNEWQKIREKVPHVLLLGNIGITQLIESPIEKIESLVQALGAKGIFVHTNPLQEALQKEGTPFFRGGHEALKRACRELSVPVILKEVGCGFSKNTMRRLSDVDLYGLDISGFGGTHWGRIEGLRSPQGSLNFHAAKTFANWGCSTVNSLKNAVELQPNFKIWASGGVRSGLDAAKLIAMGAEMVGFARPMLEAAMKGARFVEEKMSLIEMELKIALFCTGSKTLNDLKRRELLRWS